MLYLDLSVNVNVQVSLGNSQLSFPQKGGQGQGRPQLGGGGKPHGKPEGGRRPFKPEGPGGKPEGPGGKPSPRPEGNTESSSEQNE